MIAHIAYADRSRRTATFMMHYVPTPAPRLGDLLFAEEPVIELESADIRYRVSLMSVDDPYVFIDAASLGVRTQRELFADDRQLSDTLAAVRTAAGRQLGSPHDGVFVKIAAIGQFHRGRLAVRAISVPNRHATLPLTGAICLGVATTLSGMIPYQLARPRCMPAKLTIDTPRALTAVTVQVTGTDADDHLLSTSVTRKSAPKRCRSRWSVTRRSRRQQSPTPRSTRRTMAPLPAATSDG